MFRFNTNNTIYKVPVDALDLNYLSRSYDCGGPKPLWKVPSGEDYYEFKLNAWRVLEESDDEEITGLESESLICHICNTHVPIMYIKEHKNSIKHINMKKIHDLIILRGRNPDLNSSEEYNPSLTSYYCEECSMVVLKNNRQSHEASYTHKKSLRNTDLIEQFLKFYSRDLNMTQNRTPMSEYFNKFINRRNLSFKVDVVDEDNIMIIIKAYKFKLHNDNFHGFIKMDDVVICILCEVQLQVTAIEPHVESKKHRKKITRNIDDQHCMREVNENFVHCLLCNELVLSARVVGHKHLSYHMFNLNQALGRTSSRNVNKKYIMSRDTDTFFCKLSDELQSDDEESVDRSISSDESNDGESGGCENYQEDPSDIIAHNENTQATNQTYCNVCSVYMDTHNFKNHKIGSSHKQLECSKIKADQKSQQKVNAYIYKEVMAQLGDISEKLEPLAKHATKNEAKHPSCPKKDIKPINIHYHMEDSSYNIVSCRVCNLKMYIEDVNDHIKQDSHINKYENLLKINKISKNNDYLCYCKVCDDPVLVKRELDHIYSEQHRQNICNESKGEKVLETNHHLIQTNNKIKPINIHYHMEESSCNTVSCRVCNLKMYIDDMNDHISQEIHINKYENLLKNNKITKNNNYLCYCKVCDDPVLVKRELDHIYSEQHRQNIYNESKGENVLETNNNLNQVANKNDCKIEDNCNSDADTDTKDQLDDTTQLITEDIKQDGSQTQTDTEVTEIPSDFIEKVNYQILETSNEKEIICKVCNIKLTNTDVDIFKHFDSTDHVLQYNELLKINRLTKAQNKFFCYACKASITSRNELEHIFGNKHKSKFPNHDIDATCKISCQINDGHISVTVQSNDVQEKAVPQTTKDVTTSHIQNETKLVSETKNDDHITNIENVQAVFLKQYYLVTKTKIPSEVICKVCNIILTNSMINLESHMIGADHIDKYDTLLKVNGVKKQENGFYCEACKVNLTNKNELIHINGIKHQNNVLSYMIYCLEVMSTGINQGNSRETINQMSYKQNHASQVQISFEETENDTTKETINKTDDVDAGTSNDNFETDEYEEVDEPSAESENESVEYSDELENEFVENSDESDNEEPFIEPTNVQANLSKPHYHVTKTASPIEVLCIICNVLLTNSTVNIETHVMGSKHMNKYENIIDSNGLKKNNNRYFCEMCNVFVSNKNELEHIMGIRHKSNTQNGTLETQISHKETGNEAIEETIYETDDIDAGTSNNNIETDEYEEVDEPSAESETESVEYSDELENESVKCSDELFIEPANVQATSSKPHYHVTTTASPFDVQCRICNVLLSNSTVNIETHVMGFNHSTNYKNLIDSNGLKRDNNRYFCEMCNVFVPDKNEVEHIMGIRHKTRLPKH